MGPGPRTNMGSIEVVIPSMKASATLLATLLCIGTVSAPSSGADDAARPAHGLSMYGDMRYGPGFKHFEYADPKALKGGAVKLSAIGTFDTLNPFTLRGVPAAGLGQVFDTLMTNSADEAFAYYGLVAETVETPADRSWVDRKSTRLNSSHTVISYAVFCLKKK